MIVKMIILRLLGSSDDKEGPENRRSKARRATPTRVPLVGSGAPEEPMPKHRCIRHLSEEPML